MKKLLGLSLLLVLFATGASLVIKSPHAAAFSNSDLISDGVFDNSNSMNASQIDTWLNGFPSSCISPNNGFKAADPTGYSPFYPYVDGKYSYGGPVTAGQVIYDAAAAHHINPEVLLTKLQNEEQLVDGSAGCDNWRYTSAVGYACTDSGTNTHNYTYTGTDPYASGIASSSSLNDSTDLVTPLYYINGVAVNSITGSCVNANVKAGFSEQVVHAAWLLSFSRHKSEGQTGWAAVGGNWNHCEDNNTCDASFNIPSSWACYSGLMTQGNFKRCPTDSSTVFYDGYATIDGQSVHIDTGGTAALYVYTPHFQSFDTIFTNWFGSLTEVYTWDIINQFAYTDSTKTTPVDLGNLGPGQRYYIGFSLKNTGNVTWTRDGTNPMDLGTATSEDRVSPFCDPAWQNPSPSCNRPAALHEWSVAPGQIGSFEFWITTPGTPGSYNEIYAPVLESLMWLDSHTVSFPMIVANANYSWRPVSQYVFTDDSKRTMVDYSHLVAGQHYYVVLSVKNTGNILWQRGGSTPTVLGTSNPIDRSSGFCESSWIACNRPAPLHEWTVAQGQIGSFEFWIKSPSSGSYNETFNPLVETVSWMSGSPALIGGTTSPAYYSWSLINQFAYTDSSMTTKANMGQLTAGQRYFIGFSLKNTGTAIWHRGTSSPFNLGSVQNSTTGVDRVSQFCDSSWLNGSPACNRPTSLNEWTVAPGQIGSFGFWITAPASGTYMNEYFAPVVEGVTWLNDHRVFFPAIVN